MLGKQKWRSRSSQATPRETNLLAPESSSPFAEPQEKSILMRHLLHYTNVNPRPMLAFCCSWTYYLIVCL